MRRLNEDSQKVCDLIVATRDGRKWARVYCKDGKTFEGYADCILCIAYEGDEDADAVWLITRDGECETIAGAAIDRYEVLEPRQKMAQKTDG